MTEENNAPDPNASASTGDSGTPAPPTTTTTTTTDSGSDVDSIVEKVVEKLRGLQPSGGGGGLRDVEEFARREIQRVTAHLQQEKKEQERDGLLTQLKEKVEKEFAPKKGGGLFNFLFGAGDDEK